MQFNAIAAFGREAKTCNGIEASRMLLKCLLEYPGLFERGRKVYRNRSVHTESISYTQRKCNAVEERRGVEA